MRENYKSWAVKIEDFDLLEKEVDKIKFLLNFAILAPSSHNSQPWRFEVNGKNILIFLEQSRRLLKSDKNNRQAFISIGCAIENLFLAADYYGYQSHIRYSENTNSEPIAKIAFTQKNHNNHNGQHLIFSIPKRVTNRTPYSNRIPPALFLKQIQSLNSNNVRVRTIIDKYTKDAISDIALTASVDAMLDRNFRIELSHYVKPNITFSPVGMPGFGMGIPTPISFIAPLAIKFFNMNKLNHQKDKKLLKEQTPVLVIIESEKDDVLSWLAVGRIYEKIALLATANKVATAMWASPIQIGEFYKNLQKILSSDFRPQALLRLGYATGETKHSPRLNLKKLI